MDVAVIKRFDCYVWRNVRGGFSLMRTTVATGPQNSYDSTMGLNLGFCNAYSMQGVFVAAIALLAPLAQGLQTQHHKGTRASASAPFNLGNALSEFIFRPSSLDVARRSVLADCLFRSGHHQNTGWLRDIL